MNSPDSAPRAHVAMRRSDRRTSDWLIPAGLILLGLIPSIAGGARVLELAGGGEITPENARFFASPLPVVIHILSSVLFSLLGAFQFAPGFRRRHRNGHRIAGRILVPAGLFSALSGLYMTLYYPWPEFDGLSVYLLRLLAGGAMAISLVLGTVAILGGDIPRHEAWMIRGYALGLGAGTQVLTHIPFFLFPEIQGELARTICMAAGWGINLAVAEWLIRRGGRRHDSRRQASRRVVPEAVPSHSLQ